MILNIVTEPNPLLHKPTRELELAEIKEEKFQNFLADLTETMKEKDGVGIAAIQVGRPLMVCVISKEFAKTPDDLILINPKWKKASILKDWGEEGCLSVPRIYGQVKRYKKIKVKALDKTGKDISFPANGFFARIVQHEVDHLNGVLFIEKAKGLHEEKRM